VSGFKAQLGKRLLHDWLTRLRKGRAEDAKEVAESEEEKKPEEESAFEEKKRDTKA
jgi:hypothetical protein